MPLSPDVLKANIKRVALELGFADCRIAACQPARHAREFQEWLDEGCFGDMDWMARTPERRMDPRRLLEGARSMIILALNYYQGETSHPDPGENNATGVIARYAWGDDYHAIAEEKLKDLSLYLDENGGTQRPYVDYGPILERDFASESGLGWNGKSTVQIDRKLGTWFFLCEIVTTLEIPPDEAVSDHCGKCTRCIDSCPTRAITAPHKVDARKCISYLTIEHKGPIPEELRAAVGNRIFGCDDCLAICPWNRFAKRGRDASRFIRPSILKTPLREFLRFSDEEFRVAFRDSPIKRIKRTRFLRNVCVALGNTGTAADLSALRLLIQDDVDPLILEHASWAIDRIEDRIRSQKQKNAPDGRFPT